MNFLVIISMILLITGILVFAIMGMSKTILGYKNKKWEEKYGKKMKEEARRKEWIAFREMEHRVELLESYLEIHNQTNYLDEVENVVHHTDYDYEYRAWQKEQDKIPISKVYNIQTHQENIYGCDPNGRKNVMRK